MDVEESKPGLPRRLIEKLRDVAANFARNVFLLGVFELLRVHPRVAGAQQPMDACYEKQPEVGTVVCDWGRLVGRRAHSVAEDSGGQGVSNELSRVNHRLTFGPMEP